MRLRAYKNMAVTPLGIGLAALGRPGYITLNHRDDLPSTDRAAMQQHAYDVLDAAWDAGIRYFDVARSYGLGEKFLAAWIQSRHITPIELTVGSKWGYTYTADWQTEADQHEVKDHGLAALQRQWEESYALLGEHLGLYQIHSVTPDSPVLNDDAVLHELLRLKLEYNVSLGLSLSGPKQADVLLQALEIKYGDAPLFDSVQATWNLLEPSAAHALTAAHISGLVVIVKEALANGRLTPRAAVDESFAANYVLLQAQAERLETTIDGLCIAAALDQNWAGVVLSGAATVQQLQSNAQALNVQWDEEAAAALSRIAEPAEEYWRRRSKQSWN